MGWVKRGDGGVKEKAGGVKEEGGGVLFAVEADSMESVSESFWDWLSVSRFPEVGCVELSTLSSLSSL